MNAAALAPVISGVYVCEVAATRARTVRGEPAFDLRFDAVSGPFAGRTIAVWRVANAPQGFEGERFNVTVVRRTRRDPRTGRVAEWMRVIDVRVVEEEAER